MLRGIDVLLFDMQDIGARAYTYVWTMTMAMEEAARAGIPFIVLDRPNPVTARVEGPLMQFEMRNRGPLITGHFPVPLRHGLTAGELARYVNGEYRLGTRLTVVPADGWRGGDWFDETGLRWINPSPNIRTLDAALSFSGLVMLETTNLSIGRGTSTPFSYVGAPYLDNAELLRRVRRYNLPGVEFELAEFTPRGTDWMQFRNQRCRAVRLRITDREAYQPVLTALVFLSGDPEDEPAPAGDGPHAADAGQPLGPRGRAPRRRPARDLSPLGDGERRPGSRRSASTACTRRSEAFRHPAALSPRLVPRGARGETEPRERAGFRADGSPANDPSPEVGGGVTPDPAVARITSRQGPRGPLTRTGPLLAVRDPALGPTRRWGNPRADAPRRLRISRPTQPRPVAASPVPPASARPPRRRPGPSAVDPSRCRSRTR